MNQLEYARWVLERNLHWIVAVETKTAVIVAIDTAMLGALAVAFSSLEATERSTVSAVFSFLAAATLVVSVAYGALSVWPQTEGPSTSYIFFGRITNWSAEMYRKKFLDAGEPALLDDCLIQIHRNAEIASLKYARVAASMKFAFLSVPFWLLALVTLLSSKH